MFNLQNKIPLLYSPLNDGLIGWYMMLPGLENNSKFYDLLNFNHLNITTGASFNWTKPRPGGFGSLSTTGSTGATSSSATYKLPSSNGPRTISGWFHPLSSANYGLVNLTGVPSFSMYYFFDGANYHYFTDGVNSGNNQSTTTAADNLTLNTWQHMTIACTASSVSIYKNGRRVINTNWGATLNTNTTGLILGYRNNAFDGYIDDVRLWNRKLSDQEVMGVYTDSLSGYENSLYALEPMFNVTVAGGPVGNAFMALFGGGTL